MSFGSRSICAAPLINTEKCRVKNSTGNNNYRWAASAPKKMLLHLGEARLAIRAIDQGKKWCHDRTPLLIIGYRMTHLRFLPFSQAGQNGFMDEETGFVG